MDKKEIKIVLKAVMSAQDIVGFVALPNGKYGYEDFKDRQLRDIYYKLNYICLDLIHRLETTEKNEEAKENEV